MHLASHRAVGLERGMVQEKRPVGWGWRQRAWGSEGHCEDFGFTVSGGNQREGIKQGVIPRDCF